jgi:hypothetical protein
MGSVSLGRLLKKSIWGEIGGMRLAENKKDGEVNSPLQRRFSDVFSNRLDHCIVCRAPLQSR